MVTKSLPVKSFASVAAVFAANVTEFTFMTTKRASGLNPYRIGA